LLLPVLAPLLCVYRELKESKEKNQSEIQTEENESTVNEMLPILSDAEVETKEK
jgi:hypothetical protein